MKHQFKFNPLATAIFTLLCGSSVPSYAASVDSSKNLKQALQETYPGQAFFEQYYVDKTAPEAQQRAKHTNNYCQGTWLTPISASTQATAAENTTSTVTADYGHFNPNGDSLLEGNVVIDQQGRQIRADKVTIDQNQTFANAEGRVQLAQGGLISQSDAINYNLKTQEGELNNSFYIAEEQHAHGAARHIRKSSNNTVELEQASYSACPPGQDPAWRIEANAIKLNQETGRGETRNAKLYVKNVPVLALPYFNFPIDDRRTTGLLTPSFGYTNDGGLQVEMPVYLNLAPHYDATVTPRYLGGRGAMIEGEFRYLSPFGIGTIWGGYLPSDSEYNDEDRKSLHLRHDWQINEQFNTKLEYNYASDQDYFSDLDSDPDSRTELNQRRAWEINYKNGIPGLTAKLKVEDFQTLDKTVSDIDRPYARLPQFLLNYKTGNPLGLQYEFNNDTAYFKKDLSERPTNDIEPSGTRIYNDFSVRYNYRTPGSFFIPELSVRNLNTIYDQDTVNNNSISSKDETASYTIPQFTLDTGLVFEKQGRLLQTLSPRLFYAYAPYENQSGQPNFDSASASISYDQLFSPRRFYGNDRLEDNNFASFGLSYSLFDEIGLERLRASIGQSYYFEDRRVTLERDVDEYDREKRTGPVIQLSSQISQNIHLTANSAWMSNGDNAQRNLQGFYSRDNGSLYSLGYYYRKDIPNRQDQYDHIAASFIQPLSPQWKMIAHAQYDLENSVGRDYLLGINYESCCWGISVYGRSYYNDLDDVKDPSVDPKRAIMAEISLKGLGGFNNRLTSLLENRILGFNNMNQSWTQH